jgi:N-hydroxyarylamine O-acetyltransferase
MIDLDRYLARIGLDGRPTLEEVHRAHLTSIPFENLDPYRGVPISLATADLEHKLVDQRRGGYCFEQNLLLKAACETLGWQVDMFLARVRLGGAPGQSRPRSHLVLRVHADGTSWHADVGFGGGGPLEPLPFGLCAAHEQSGWLFRVLQEGPELVLQTVDGGDWIDLYGFTEEPVPLVDVEVINWYTSTHPHSPFVSGLIVNAQGAHGARTTLSDWDGLMVTEQTPAHTNVTPVEWAAVPGLLASHFGLCGFSLGANQRLVLAR